MGKFDCYFLMNEEDVKEYVLKKTVLFDKNSKLSCEEIGDGYLNYVYRIKDIKTNKSIIVKQSTREARIDNKIKLSVDRMRIECEMLQLGSKIVEGLVPQIYFYDENMGLCCMEDISRYEKLTDALLEQRILPKFPEQISTYLFNSLFLTTDICLDHKVKKNAVKNFINPELSELKEEGIYTEPFDNICNRNIVAKENLEFIRRELYEDEKLHLEVAKCKFDFMNNTQALLHGDLHSGAIFVTENELKIIDAEFACYGPIGYDIGYVLSNMYLAWINAYYNMNDKIKREVYLCWIEKVIKDIVDLFIKKCLNQFNKTVIDKVALVSGFKEWYINNIIKDTAAVTGLSIIWRSISVVKGREISEIIDYDKLVAAERKCVLDGKSYIMNRENFNTGEDFIKIIRKGMSRL